MKIRDVIEKTGATVLAPGDAERGLSGAISGDLLSFIMAEAKEGWLWITIQVHLNVAAVAVLKDVPF
ncbi:MAG: serine kinase, partial [Synergistaceae bacterium]|nr:serine kinase [Synergistaceae bacterium]